MGVRTARAKHFRSDPYEGHTWVAGSDVADLEMAEARYVKAVGGELTRRDEAMVVSHPRLRHPAFNVVLHLSTSEERFGELMRAVEAQFNASGTPFSVVTSPATQPREAGALLEARGYLRASRRMWMELQGEVPERPHDTLIAARPTEDIDSWAETAARAAGIPGHADFLAAVARESASAPRHRLILATYRDRPAGACEVAADGNVAFLRHFGVLEEYRSKGIAAALLSAACESGMELRALHLATRVFAGAQAELLLERYGFERSHISEEYVREFPDFLVE